MNGAELCGLVASRICHDLISPVGAISNGLELLEMSPGGGGEEVALIRQSADAATASLKFMRIAFGAPGLEDVMAQPDAARILTTYLTQGRRRAEWAPQGAGIARADAQILFLGALRLADMAPLGGVLSIERAASGPLDISLVIRAARISTPPPVSTPPTPREAHRVFLDTLVDARGARLDWDVASESGDNSGEGYARLTVSAP